MSIFNQVKSTRPPSNTFDLSHDRKLSMKMGELTPILCMDVVPGDKISLSTSQMMRFAPMIAPVMHKINLFTHFYFVPNRLCWNNWEDFITGGEDGLQEPVFPNLSISEFDVLQGSLADHLGVPSTQNMNEKVISALPFSAYQQIYNEYYRDQNLIDKVPYTNLTDSTQSAPARDQLMSIRTRAWEHDYFTSALPWTQKGAEATIPLGTSAPVSSDLAGKDTQRMKGLQGGNVYNLDLAVGSSRAFGDTGNTEDWWLDLGSSHVVDLSSATAASINDLRQAFKLQEWLEKNARGGSRYIESIKSHFGVTSPDARLQRPEYLGGGSAPITISEVLQTQGTDVQESATTTPQGNMAGHGISVGQSNNFSFRATEHGYIIGIMTVMPRTAYFQGLPKHLKKFDKFDYYWPSFAHLGEQPILMEELWIDPSQAKNEETFGYTPRYAEYKHMLSTVHGEMRGSLNFWHYARIFENQPRLNKEFIECKPDGRIFAVDDTETIYAHVHHRIKARRLMPMFGTPSL